jgi:hypothetical protein
VSGPRHAPTPHRGHADAGKQQATLVGITGIGSSGISTLLAVLGGVTHLALPAYLQPAA